MEFVCSLMPYNIFFMASYSRSSLGKTNRDCSIFFLSILLAVLATYESAGSFDTFSIFFQAACQMVKKDQKQKGLLD